MQTILNQLFERLASGIEGAWCRLVETRGSTPQKAGASMVVLADGSQLGTLGGGCVEAEVKRRALAAIEQRASEVAKFQLDSDYGWDDGLICGGRMQVVIEPLAAETTQNYFRRLAEFAERGAGATEAIVFDAEASGLAAPTAYLFDEHGALAASLPPGIAPDDVPDSLKQTLRPVATRPRPYAGHGVAYLPLLPRCRLVIVGGGHVGRAVANLASDLDFDVWVVDDREEIISSERFPRAERRIAGDIGKVLTGIEITPNTYCLIVTRGHNHDEEALFHLANRGAAYVGMIGSKRKIKLIMDDLVQEGIAPEVLERVYAPVGLDIGSQSVPEIAVAIAAQLISHRNQGSEKLEVRS